MKINRREFLEATGAATSVALMPQSGIAQEEIERQAESYVWPPRQGLPTFARPKHLDAADIRQLTATQQLLLITLQGVVNRRRPRLYFFLAGDNTDQVWLNTFDVPNTITSDPLSLIEKYRRRIRGAIVYDPALPDTINVATSLAGLEDAVVTTAELANEYQLPILRDLRGQFANKLDAYKWLVDDYWTQLNHRLLTGIVGAEPAPLPNIPWTTLFKVQQPVTDESNRGIYTADLTGLLGGKAVYVRYSDAYTNDGWGPSVAQVTITANGTVIASFQPGTDAEKPFLYEAGSSQLASAWRFADGNSSFIYRFEPPAGITSLQLQTTMWNSYFVEGTNTPPIEQRPFANFRDYIVATRAMVFALDPLVSAEAELFRSILDKVEPNTPYLGWFIGGHENSGVTLCAQHGVPVVAADFFNNGTVFGGLRAPVKAWQPSVTAPVLENKVYVTFTISEGDNLQYCQHKMRSLWDDPQRGQTPLNWSISPLLLDAGPEIYNYFQASQTNNDLFVAGPSGASYTYPGAWPAEDLPAFTKQTGRYMRRLGLDVIYTLNRANDTNIDLSDAVVAQYLKNVRLAGILSNWISTSQLSQPAGLPVMTQVGIGSVAEGQRVLAEATANWDGNSPFFVAIGVLAWNMNPTDVTTLAASLGPQYSAVRADVYFALLKQQLAKANG